MNQPVDRCQRHDRIGEDLSPLPERLICGNEDRPPLVSRADEFEEYGRFRLILGDVGEVVEDQEMEAVEPRDGGLEGQFAPRDVEFLNQIGRAGESSNARWWLC